jgi:hypothetical protein
MSMYIITPMQDLIAPGKTKSFFKLTLDYDHFHAGDVLNTTYVKLLIITQPKRKWYKLLLQYITFTIYKAPWEYQVEKQN